MNQNLLALYGLKWNPFSPELPTEAIHVPAKIENFCWRIEHAHSNLADFYREMGDIFAVPLRPHSGVVGASALTNPAYPLRVQSLGWLQGLA